MYRTLTIEGIITDGLCARRVAECSCQFRYGDKISSLCKCFGNDTPWQLLADYLMSINHYSFKELVEDWGQEPVKVLRTTNMPCFHIADFIEFLAKELVDRGIATRGDDKPGGTKVLLLPNSRERIGDEIVRLERELDEKKRRLTCLL